MTLRLARLLVGLVLYGAGCGLTVAAGLGVDPWTVLAEGLSLRTSVGIGWMANLLGAVVLLAWIPLRQRPGIGTVLNVLVVGTSIQVTVDAVPPIEGLAARLGTLLGGIALVAFASALYLGARLGPGPRDGLMEGLATRLGWSRWRSRTTIELSVLVAGWLLGGTVGLGTILFALLVGPGVHLAIRVLPAHPTRAPHSGSAGPADPD